MYAPHSLTWYEGRLVNNAQTYTHEVVASAPTSSRGIWAKANLHPFTDDGSNGRQYGHEFLVKEFPHYCVDMSGQFRSRSRMKFQIGMALGLSSMSGQRNGM